MRQPYKVLIFGASGILGNKLYKQIQTNLEYETYGTYFSSNNYSNQNIIYSDCRNFLEIKELILQLKPKYVINCVAITNVDYCEKNPELSKKINLEFPIFLSDYCAARQIKFVHISTDHFSSKSPDPRIEETEMYAVNVYGRHKLGADIHIKQSNSNSLIIRTNFFGLDCISKKTLLDWVLDCYTNRIEFTGYANVYFSPLSLQELVKCIMILVNLEVSGIVNLASDESVSKFDFMRIVGEELSADVNLLVSGVLKSSHALAPRPFFMSLNNAKFKILTNHQSPSLRSMIRSVLQENS
jgi:dTDP-4-dehydrorhamnose reductase